MSLENCCIWCRGTSTVFVVYILDFAWDHCLAIENLCQKISGDILKGIALRIVVLEVNVSHGGTPSSNPPRDVINNARPLIRYFNCVHTLLQIFRLQLPLVVQLAGLLRIP